MNATPLVERAFQPARSGHYSAAKQIERAMMHEGYVFSDIRGHLQNQSLSRQLSALMRAAPRPVAAD